MFTDIRGFSDLAARDEDAAMRVLHSHNQLVRACIRRHGGVVLKVMGDAFMGRFDAASHAVDCALDVQRRLTQWNRRVRPANRLLVRIGVHVGDAVVARDDILGVVPNLAKRLESHAPAGGVCCSDAVRLMIVHLPQYRFRLLRRAKLRGSARQMALYVVTAGREGWV
jgi:class 3 adenylate cyclase